MLAETINVLLVDDHPLAIAGVRTVLQAFGIHVRAEAGNAADAMNALATGHIDVAILDIAMPAESGLALLERIRRVHPDTKVLMLSTHAEEIFAIRALRGGANGYLTKGAPPELLVEAVQTVARGGRHFSGELTDRLLREVYGGSTRHHDKLAPREFEVMSRLVNGESNGAIAEQLHLSPKTISTHRTRIFQKLGVGSIAELTRLAIEEGLVDRTVRNEPAGLPDRRKKR